MDFKEFFDREGRKFTWDEADGYGWFSEMTKNLLENPLRNQMDKVKGFEMRDDDVLVCAFPKAGTNWVWEMASMIKRGEAKYDANFKVNAMLEFRSLRVLNSIPPPRVYNTHVYPSCLPGDVLKKKVKIIQVMRHPKDMAVSFYYHFKQNNFLFENPPFETFSEFLPYITGEYGVFLLVSMFRYLQEFESFITEYHNMVLILYFEEMKQNPIDTVRRIAEFFNADLSPDIINQITGECSFDRMKETESSGIKQFIPEMFAYIGERELARWQGQSDMSLFRRGEIGDWKSHFTVAESEHFDKLINENLKDNMFIKYYFGKD